MELAKLLHYHFTLLRYKQMLIFPISRHFAKTMFLSCLLLFILHLTNGQFFLAERGKRVVKLMCPLMMKYCTILARLGLWLDMSVYKTGLEQVQLHNPQQ